MGNWGWNNSTSRDCMTPFYSIFRGPPSTMSCVFFLVNFFKSNFDEVPGHSLDLLPGYPERLHAHPSEEFFWWKSFGTQSPSCWAIRLQMFFVGYVFFFLTGQKFISHQSDMGYLWETWLRDTSPKPIQALQLTPLFSIVKSSSLSFFCG